MNRWLASFQVLFVSCLALAALGGCKGSPVGRQCFIGAQFDGGVPQTVVASPALECQSRTCLHIAGKDPDMCTAECTTDEDCDTVSESPCKGGFVCAIPVVTGSFCCKRMCMCKDQVVIPDGGIKDPEACNADNPVNECCNLAGRQNNSMYPGCTK